MVDPIIAAILSFIIPGLGQAIAGDVKKGIIFFVVAIVIIFLSGLIFRNWLEWIIRCAVAIYAAYDAYLMAQE